MVQCWICYGEEDISHGSSSVDGGDGDFNDRWVAPCNCRGSLEWVHQECIRSWIDSAIASRQSGNVFRLQDDELGSAACPHCRHPFAFRGEPPVKLMPYVQGSLAAASRLYSKALQIATAGVAAGFVYAGVYAYGLFAVVAFCGARPTWRAFLRPAIDDLRGPPLNAIPAALKLALTFPLAVPAVLYSLRSGDALWMLPLASMWVNSRTGRESSRLTRAIVLAAAPIATVMRLLWLHAESKRAKQSPTLPPASATSNDDSAPGAFFDQQVQQEEIAISPTSTTAITIDMSNLAVEASNSLSPSSGLRGTIYAVLETMSFPFISSSLGWLISGLGSLLLLPRTTHANSSSRWSVFEQSSVGAALVVSFRAAGALLYANRRSALLRPRTE